MTPATAILILHACFTGTNSCHYVVGQHTLLSECIAMSQAVGAAWANVNPGLELRGLDCVDPKDLHKYLGRDA